MLAGEGTSIPRTAPPILLCIWRCIWSICQRVYFKASNATQRSVTPSATTLTSFFAICQSDQFARTLLYSEMQRYYTWNASSKNFQRRKQGDAVPGYPDVRSTDALGRMYKVHPKNN